MEATQIVVDCSGTLPPAERVRVVPLTDAELAQRKIDAEEADRVGDSFARTQRNALLSASDWTQMPDAPLSDAKRKAWAKYRQALRDNPTGPWPERP